MRSVLPVLLLGLLMTMGACDSDSDTPSPPATGSDAGSDATSSSQNGQGSISLSWEIAKQGAPSTCISAGGQSVEVKSEPSAGQPLVDLYDCSDSKATVKKLPPGGLKITLSLLDPSNKPIATSAPVDVTVVADKDTPVAPAIKLDVK